MKNLLFLFTFFFGMSLYAEPLQNQSFEDVNCSNPCPTFNSIFLGCSNPWSSSHGNPSLVSRVGFGSCNNVGKLAQDGDRYALLATGGIFQDYEFEACVDYKVTFWVREFNSGNECDFQVALANNLTNFASSNANWLDQPLIPSEMVFSDVVDHFDWKEVSFIMTPSTNWNQLWIRMFNPDSSDDDRFNHLMGLDNILIERIDESCVEYQLDCEASISTIVEQTGPNEGDIRLRFVSSGNPDPNPSWTFTNLATDAQYIVQNQEQVNVLINSICSGLSNCDFGVPSGTYEICLTVGIQIGNVMCFDEECIILNTNSPTGGNTSAFSPGDDGVINHAVEAINVFPNPSSDHINLTSPTFIESIELINLQGQVIKTAKENDEIFVGDQAPGTMLLRIKTIDADGTMKYTLKKIIIQ